MKMKNLAPLLPAVLLIMACNSEQKHSGQHQDDSTKLVNKPAKQDMMMHEMHESMDEMHKVQLTGNPDYDFAAMMIPHHKGAVDMADLQKREGKDEELKQFSDQVMQAQTQEIRSFEAFMRSAKKDPVGNAETFKQEFGQTMEPMMQSMQGMKSSGSVDKDFVTMMIPHHQSAVKMAEVYLKHGKDESIRRIAFDIIKNQNAEITWLENWLKKNP